VYLTGVPAAAQEALRTSHVVGYRVTAYTPLGVLRDLPFSDGSVTYDSGSQVRRSASLTIGDPTLWPADPVGVLSPVGTELAVEYGIEVPGLPTVWVPLIRGPVQLAKRSRPHTTTAIPVDVADRSSWIAEDRFDVPVQTVTGATAVAEITRLITESRPGTTVRDLTGSTQIAAQLDIDRERWADGIEALADSIGAEVYADREGGFVIAPTPTFTAAVPVWTINAGESGNLLKIDEEVSRERVYNAVVASGERTDGTVPTYAKVVDDVAGSPTQYGGTFGKRPFFFTSSLLTTTEQCTAAAAARLERVRGLHGKVTVEAVTNPLLDAGDLIAVIPREGGPAQVHIVDKVDIPLDPTVAQKIETRTLDATAGGA
jgi:hypothetical protein